MGKLHCTQELGQHTSLAGESPALGSVHACTSMLTFTMNTPPKFLNGNNQVKVWALQTTFLNFPINLLPEMLPWPQLLNRQRGLSNKIWHTLPHTIPVPAQGYSHRRVETAGHGIS